MSTAQHSIIPLSALTHAAIEATGYSPDGRVVVVRTSPDGIEDVAVHDLDDIGAMTAPASTARTAIALIFPDADRTTDLNRIAEQLHSVGAELRNAGGSWDTIVARGGVRFTIFSEHGWLEEPESDTMPNSRLDELIGMFSGTAGPSRTTFDVRDIDSACDQWVSALQEGSEGRGAVLDDDGSLRAGAVRDAVIVWAVGREGSDRLLPGARFVPPRERPCPRRINAALALLAGRVGASDTVHALACAAYLAWWSGHTRLAAHLYYRVRSTGQRSRLGTLVWTALIRDISPHWMREGSRM